jgi:hypothetical protein
MSNLINANKASLFSQVNLTAERPSTTLTTMLPHMSVCIGDNGD